MQASPVTELLGMRLGYRPVVPVEHFNSLENVERHLAASGLVYWEDINYRRIETSDPGIGLTFVPHQDDEARTVALLRYDGRSIAFFGPNGYLEPEAYEAEDGTVCARWIVDDIGGDLMTCMYEKVGRSLMAGPPLNPAFHRYRLNSARRFHDRADQSRALALLEELISRHNGDWSEGAAGRCGRGEVVLTAALEARLEAGALIGQPGRVDGAEGTELRH